MAAQKAEISRRCPLSTYKEYFKENAFLKMEKRLNL
jgi:hypothetical protein